MPKEKRHFCYLLRSLNKQFSNSTYIGYTVNPKRRIRQHNREIGNGAWKTHKAMPWEMVVVVCGFPSHTDGLSFEWSCRQHPLKSRVCREFISPTLARRRKCISKIEIALLMLSHTPWCTMNLSMIITNVTLFEEVNKTLAVLVEPLRVYNQQLQSLYDGTISSDESSEEEEEKRLSIINSHFDSEGPMYIPNAYCSSFNVVCSICIKQSI